MLVNVTADFSFESSWRVTKAPVHFAGRLEDTTCDSLCRTNGLHLGNTARGVGTDNNMKSAVPTDNWQERAKPC